MTGSADTATVEALLSAYLDRVAAGLRGLRRHRSRILAELSDGLHEATAGRLLEGLPAERAATAAIASFGDPDEVAAGFGGELVTGYARHTLAWYLLTGPAVGLWWLLLLQPSPWHAGVAALAAAIPVLPLVVVAVAAAATSLATTGRLMRWLPETGPQRALAATRGVAVLAVAGDLLIFAVCLRSTVAAGPLLATAVTASLIRIGCGLVVLRRTTALRRATRRA